MIKGALKSCAIDGDVNTVRSLMDAGDTTRPINALFLGIHPSHFSGLDRSRIDAFKTMINNSLAAQQIEKACQIAELFLTHPTPDLETLLNDKWEMRILNLLPFFVWLAKNDRDDMLNNEWFKKVFKVDSIEARNAFKVAAAFSSKKFLLKAKENKLLTINDCRDICTVAAANGDTALLSLFPEFLDYDLVSAAEEESDYLRVDDTPLFWAIANHQIDSATHIVMNGANLQQHAVAAMQDSYLSFAVRSEWEAGVRLLLKHGANVDHQDTFKCTPLHSAADRNNVAVMKILIEAGADLEIKNRRNERPLDCITDHNVRSQIEEFIVDLKNRSQSRTKPSC